LVHSAWVKFHVAPFLHPYINIEIAFQFPNRMQVIGEPGEEMFFTVVIDVDDPLPIRPSIFELGLKFHSMPQTYSLVSSSFMLSFL